MFTLMIIWGMLKTLRKAALFPKKINQSNNIEYDLESWDLQDLTSLHQ